jgi:hypothetical protein
VPKCFYCGKENDELEDGVCPSCFYVLPPDIDIDDDGWDDVDSRAEINGDGPLEGDLPDDGVCGPAYDKVCEIERQREDGYICWRLGCTERPTHELKFLDDEDDEDNIIERYCDEHAAHARGCADVVGSVLLSEHPIEVLEFAAPTGQPRFIVIHTFENNRIETHASITNWSVPAMARALLEAGYAGRLGAVTFNSPALLVMALDGDAAGAADALAAPVSEVL